VGTKKRGLRIEREKDRIIMRVSCWRRIGEKMMGIRWGDEGNNVHFKYEFLIWKKRL
jgi:hypothetical protein